MKVMKFGGSCLQSAAGLKRLLELVSKEARPLAIVLSALKGVTDDLIALTEAAARGGAPEKEARLGDLRRRHEEAIRALPAENRTEAQRGVDALLQELQDLLRGVQFLREAPPRARDQILSIGERLSVALATEHLKAAGLPAVAKVCDEAGIVTTREPLDARIKDESLKLARTRLPEDQDAVFVVTGFLGRDDEGRITTLGRGGSDYTATFLAAALGGPCILWKDTPGLLTADPRVVSDTRVIERIGYLDALELAHYGLQAVAEKALYPAMKAGTPIEIRSFVDGTAPTVIGPDATDALAISWVRDVAMLDLVDLEPDESVRGRVLRSLARILETFADAGSYPLLVTEASPRGETTIALKAAHLGQAREALEKPGAGISTSVRTGLSAVSLIGSGMRGRIGFAASVFETLAKARVNIVAIAQTASERNISVVVARDQAEEAVRALHKKFVTAS
ncbi:MAG TPA: aspartate kinase [Planctomycetota bacterium]|nr:aspartate kinase [Planctomycetota bacterium]